MNKILFKEIIKKYKDDINDRNFTSLFNKLYKENINSDDTANFVIFLLSKGVNPFVNSGLFKSYSLSDLYEATRQLSNLLYVFTPSNYRIFFPVLPDDVLKIAYLLGFDIYFSKPWNLIVYRNSYSLKSLINMFNKDDYRDLDEKFKPLKAENFYLLDRP